MRIITLFTCILSCMFFAGACAVSTEPGPGRETIEAVSPETTTTGKEVSVKTRRTATLTWEAPTTNTDGSLLTDLAGYTVYYSRTRGRLKKMKTLALTSKELFCTEITRGEQRKKGRTECTYTVPGLDQGVYYFSVRAYNSEGRESDASNEVKK